MRRMSTDLLRGKSQDQRLDVDEVIQQLLSVKGTDDKQAGLTFAISLTLRRHGDSFVGKEKASPR